MYSVRIWKLTSLASWRAGYLSGSAHKFASSLAFAAWTLMSARNDRLVSRIVGRILMILFSSTDLNGGSVIVLNSSPIR